MQQSYPWTTSPLIVCAPMLLITLAPLAVAVSKAGGLGVIGAGTNLDDLDKELQHAAELLKQSPIPGTSSDTLPVGVGFLNWGANLEIALAAVRKYRPIAAWFYAPRKLQDLVPWTEKIREASQNKTKIWIQIGTVAEAVEVCKLCKPDVVVVQGADSGGHGLEHGAGIITLLPEIADALDEEGFDDIVLIAAGGIMEGRGTAACLTLGAQGVVMGTRFLASAEAKIAKGYQSEVIRARDGGVSTARTTVYDTIRGTKGWPSHYNGRGLINQSYRDAQAGMSKEENQKLYAKALATGDQGWGIEGRLTTYAGTGVGLVKEVKTAKEIVEEVRRVSGRVLSANKLSS